MSEAAAALQNVLSTHQVTKVSASRLGRVIELDSTLSPLDAAAILWKNNILGAPVWEDEAQKYTGFFDMRDILSAVVVFTNAKKDFASSTSCADRSTTENNDVKYQLRMGYELSEFYYNLNSTKVLDENIKNDIFKTDVSAADMDIAYCAARNPFVFCSSDALLLDLCKCFIEQKCHRVPIINSSDSKKCQSIISQSALVKFLYENCPQDKLTETLQEANFPYKKEVTSIVDTAKASEAFAILDKKRMSGIAVVDEDGKLVGNTSARDIKLAAMDDKKSDGTSMDMDILSYLSSLRQETFQRKERYPICHVHEDVTVGHVIGILTKTGYHRVFVVDEEKRPVGVVSVADILKFAMSA